VSDIGLIGVKKNEPLDRVELVSGGLVVALGSVPDRVHDVAEDVLKLRVVLDRHRFRRREAFAILRLFLARILRALNQAASSTPRVDPVVWLRALFFDAPATI